MDVGLSGMYSGLFGGYMLDTYEKLNELGAFPRYRYERNKPEFARKKDQGRNEKCLCGSGIKYKKCCGK